MELELGEGSGEDSGTTSQEHDGTTGGRVPLGEDELALLREDTPAATGDVTDVDAE